MRQDGRTEFISASYTLPKESFKDVNLYDRPCCKCGKGTQEIRSRVQYRPLYGLAEEDHCGDRHYVFRLSALYGDLRRARCTAAARHPPRVRTRARLSPLSLSARVDAGSLLSPDRHRIRRPRCGDTRLSRHPVPRADHACGHGLARGHRRRRTRHPPRHRGDAARRGAADGDGRARIHRVCLPRSLHAGRACASRTHAGAADRSPLLYDGGHLRYPARRLLDVYLPLHPFRCLS